MRERCDWDEFQDWASFVADARNSPEAVEKITGVPAELIRGAARLYATGGNAAIYYGLGVTEHSQGSTTVMAHRQSRHGHRQYRPRGRRREPAARPEQRPGLLRHGLVPARAARLSPRLRRRRRAQMFETLWGVPLDAEPGLRIPNMLDAALDGTFKGIYIQGEDIVQSDPNTQHVAAGLAAMECVVVQDLFLNETANYAHVFLPGSTFLEKDGTFTNAERRIQRVRKVMAPRNGYADWEITAAAVRTRSAIRCTTTIRPRSWTRSRALTPTFAGVSLREARRARLGAVAVQREGAGRHAGHAYRRLRRAARASSSSPNMCRPTRRPARASRCCSPPAASSRQYNVGAQTRRTANVVWHEEDGWKSIRTTPRTAASATAIGSSSRAAPAKRPCAP